MKRLNAFRFTMAVALALGVGVSGWVVYGTSRPEPVETQRTDRTTRHPTVIRHPVKAPEVATGHADAQGRPITVACNVCHSTRPANTAVRGAADLDEFHQGLTFAHGNLACVACHHPDQGYSKLRLADGRAIEFSESMQLCAQCHGPQYRDYQHGAHGGMTGHWDLTKGPRTRNACTACHDPHAPKFPTLRPAPGPRDRMTHTAPPEGHGHE
jgi:hypothetical protein